MSKNTEIQTKSDAGPILEADYQRHSHIVDVVKNDYLQVFREIILKLNTGQLQPFENILLEKECFELCSKELIESLQQKLLLQLQSTMDRFWEECDVGNSLITLEMLKEKFKDYDGKDWKILAKKPEELCMPTRVRFKKTRIRYLQKQLEFQNKHLEDILEANKKHRDTIEDVRNMRAFCKQAMENNVKVLQEMKPRILEMQEHLIEVCEKI